MKRILITAAGGAPAINFTRSLRDSKKDYFLLGIDADPYTIHRAETDSIEICPKATEPDYIDYLNYLIKKYEIDFIHSQPDVEVGVISKNREKLLCKTFLPNPETVKILRDKYQSYVVWSRKGVPVPKTILLNTPEDLKKAYELFGKDIWIREIEGAAGKGSMASPEYEEAVKHISKNNGWGKYTAAERLTQKTVTWMSIFYEGELVIAQTRERLYWEHGNRTQSGVTGVTGTGRTIADELVNRIAKQAIFAVDDKPHGIFSVDMTYHENGIPMPTEINIGKFFTTHYFFTKAGVNFPEIYLSLAFGEQVPYREVINPLPVGLNWIRGMDKEPVLISDDEINKFIEKFKSQRQCLVQT